MVKVKREIKCFSDIFKYPFNKLLIKHKDVRKNGGYNYHIRLIIAQILWIYLIYKGAGVLNIFRDNFLSTSSFSIGALGLVLAITGLLKKIPLFNFIGDLLVGKFISDFEEKPLTQFILLLLFIGAVINILLVYDRIAKEISKSINIWFKKSILVR